MIGISLALFLTDEEEYFDRTPRKPIHHSYIYIIVSKHIFALFPVNLSNLEPHDLKFHDRRYNVNELKHKHTRSVC